MLSEAIRPDRSASIYMGACLGEKTGFKTIILVRPDTRNIHVNAYLNNIGWKGWKTYS